MRPVQRLDLQANALRRVVSHLRADALTWPAYEVIRVTDNVFVYPGTSLLAQSIMLKGNQFRGTLREQGTAILVGLTGVVSRNEADDPDAVIVWSLERRAEVANLLGVRDMNVENFPVDG